jgi:hypothetical protein
MADPNARVNRVRRPKPHTLRFTLRMQLDYGDVKGDGTLTFTDAGTLRSELDRLYDETIILGKLEAAR